MLHMEMAYGLFIALVHQYLQDNEGKYPLGKIN